MSSDQHSRKRKSDSTSSNMGGVISKIFGGKSNSYKTGEQQSSSKIAKIDEEPSDKIDEVKTEVTPSTSLERGDENAEEKPDKIVVKTEVKEEPSDKTDEVKTETADDLDHVEVKVSPSKAFKEEPSSDVVDEAEEKAETSIVDDVPPPLKREDDGPEEELLPLDDTPESSPNASPVREKKTKVEKKEAGSDQEIEEEKVVVKRQGSSSSLRSKKPKTIADMGYHFNSEGKLRSIEGDNVFKFTTQKAYEELGDLIGERVYELMIEAGLEKKYFEINRNRRFYFASPDYAQKARILVLIHGSGVVKAGQWARKLIINESLERGAQLEYIKRGLALGWGVVVLNYNEKCEGQENRCHAPDSHGVQEWKHAFSRRTTADAEIVVVAHSYGGSVISDAVRGMHRQEDYRVLCVALTDSWFSEGKEVYAVNWNTQKKKLHRSSGTYQMYSGDDTHEGTSAACINAVFALLEAVQEDMDVEDFCDLLEISEKMVLAEFAERMRKKREEKGETASTKSLELVGEKENKTKQEKAKGDEKEDEEEKKEGEEVKKEKKAIGDDEEEEKEDKKSEESAEVKKDEDKPEQKQEEVKEGTEKMEVDEPERNPAHNEDDSDEGVEKDVSSPEKSDKE